MQPRIVNLREKKLVGKQLITSLVNNKTGELWKSFMPRRKEITNNIQIIFWTTDHTLRYLEKNIKIIIQIQKKKSGYRYDGNKHSLITQKRINK